MRDWATERLDALAVVGSSVCGGAVLGWRLYHALAFRAAVAASDDAGPDELGEALRVFLRQSGRVLRGYLKDASDAFLERTALELASAQSDNLYRLAWQKVRSLTVRGGAKYKGARALPGRVDSDGRVATDAHDVAGVVLRHFAGVEAAEVCSVEALADRHATAASPLAPGSERDVSLVCDLVTLRRLFSRSRRGKACGIDGVRDDYLAIAPSELAAAYHPLLTKCSLLVQEPLAHKCGIAVDLWKRKGDHGSMQNYRSLLLNSAVQKLSLIHI